MKKEVGLWIDHRKTVIVTIENKEEAILEISSNMEKHVRFSDSSRTRDPHGSLGSTAEDVRDRQFGDHLGRYYEGIISRIRDADSILIFGPGEAKVELENKLKAEDLGGRIVGIETVDKMTTPQIAAKVRTHYKEKSDIQ
jgi:hypothetical protein